MHSEDQATMATPNAGRKWWGWGVEGTGQVQGPSSTATVRDDPGGHYRIPPTIAEASITSINLEALRGGCALADGLADAQAGG